MSRGYDADLTAASSIDDAAVALHDKYGFSPTNAEWEAFAQSRAGAVMVLQLPGDTDMDEIRANLDRLGYQKPSSDNGVWDGGADLVSGIDPTISPELQYVVVDDRRPPGGDQRHPGLRRVVGEGGHRRRRRARLEGRRGGRPGRGPGRRLRVGGRLRL